MDPPVTPDGQAAAIRRLMRAQGQCVKPQTLIDLALEHGFTTADLSRAILVREFRPLDATRQWAPILVDPPTPKRECSSCGVLTHLRRGICPRCHHEEQLESSRSLAIHLKPCPFCGHREPAFMVGVTTFGVVVECQGLGCFASTHDGHTAEQAARLWNRRAEPVDHPTRPA